MRHDDDRFFNVVCKAEKSKLVREVILRSVPAGLKSEIEKAAAEALGEFMDDGALQSLIDGFAEKNVSVEQIEKLIGKRKENFLTADRTKLLGLWNAVKDGESSVNEVFGDEQAEPPAEGESATQALADELAADAKAKP